MPTAAERQALIFLAAVALVGGGVRVMAARRFEQVVAKGENGPGPPRDGDAALRQQIAAVDSARAARAAGRGRRKAKGVVTASANRPPSRVRRDEPTLSRGGRRSPPEQLDVNSATADELERLPRVGPALARRIVTYREQHGAFASIEDLRHVRGIGVTTAALLAPLVTFSSGYRPFRSETRPSGRDSLPLTM